MVEKVVKVTNKGMISIPAEIRKKHNIKDGDYVLVEEDESAEHQRGEAQGEESLGPHDATSGAAGRSRCRRRRRAPA